MIRRTFVCDVCGKTWGWDNGYCDGRPSPERFYCIRLPDINWQDICADCAATLAAVMLKEREKSN